MRSVAKPDNPRISLHRQCELLGIIESVYYCCQRPAKQKLLEVMHLIDGFCEGNESASHQALIQYFRVNNYVVSKSSLYNQLCSMGFVAT